MTNLLIGVPGQGFWIRALEDPASSYSEFDVLELPTDGGDAQDDEPERRFYLLDPGPGKRVVDDPELVSTGVLTYVWICTTLEELAQLRAFLDDRRGRGVPFWLPTYKHHITLNGNHVAAHDFIDIKFFGYAENMFPGSGGRRHLFFRSPTGEVFYRKAVSAVNNQNGTESIYLEAPLGETVTTDWMVGFLRLCRLEDDLTRIEHLKGGAGLDRYARATLRIREIPKEAPL